MHRFLAFLAAALVVAPLFAQTQPVRRTIANFPTCDANTDGAEVIALDPTGDTDCSTGGGTAAPHPCVCDGGATTWNAISGGGGVSDHGGLTGLADDDHTQYALLAGRSGSTVFNDLGADVDFRVEGDTVADLLFADASTDRVGIGTASPSKKLHIEGAGATLRVSGTGGGSFFDVNDVSANVAQMLKLSASGSATVDFEPRPSDGTSTAQMRIFRGTNTSGAALLSIYQGNNTGNEQHRLRGNGDSFLSAVTGSFALFGTGSFGSGVGVLSLANATTVPTTNPAAGTILYSAPVATNKSNLFVQNEEGHVAQLSGVDVVASSDFVRDGTSGLNVPGLIFHVEAGKTYSFVARLPFDANATGGHKWGLGTNGTTSAAIVHIRSLCDSTGAYVITSRVTSFGGATVGQAGCTAGYTEITATATFSAAGQVWVEFAQNAASGQSFVKRGSSFHRRVVAPG